MKSKILPCVIFAAFAITSCGKDVKAPVAESKTTNEAKTTVATTQSDEKGNNTCGNHGSQNPNGGY